VATKSVLVCDLGHARVKYALVTRRFVVELDLCKEHDKDVLSGKAIVIPKGFLRLAKKERETKKVTKKKSKVDYEMLTAQILGFANRIGKPFTGRDVWRALKLSSDSVAHKAILVLIKQGKLKAKGNGPARRIELAAPKTNGRQAA
jgi:hypothetical protein